MANTTRAKILIIAPELSTSSPAIFDLILSDVATLITSGTFGTLQEKAQRYLAAHLITVSASRSGVVIEEKVGDESVKYADPVGSVMSRYDTTPYGREFMSIRRGCVGGMLTVTPDG